jgi:heme-degrading monooxygenase HmoA
MRSPDDVSAGLYSEQLLRSRENSTELISLSTWEDQTSLDRYCSSDAHKQIQQHIRALMNVAKITLAIL